MAYQHIKMPSTSKKFSVNKDFAPMVPENPIIPFIEGDGTGADITLVSRNSKTQKRGQAWEKGVKSGPSAT